MALEARGTDATGLIGTLQLVTAAAVVAGARLHRPVGAPPSVGALPWWLLASGLALSGGRRVALATVGPSPPTEMEWLVAAARPMSLALYVAAAVAVVALRARRGSAQQLLEAAIVTLAFGLVAVEVARTLIAAPVSPVASVLPPLLWVALGTALVAVTGYLWHTDAHGAQRGRGHIALALLVAAAMARLVRDVLGMVEVADVAAALAAGLTPIALGLAAAGMLHPTSPRMVEPAAVGRRPSNARQLVAFGSALLVLPLVGVSLAVRGTDDAGWVTVTAVGMVVLTVLVMARLERLLRSLRAATALREAEARQDLPTGLPNTRGLFDDLAERGRRRDAAGPPGLLVISLAGVGEAGSVHGLDVSAAFLGQLAQRLASVLPPDACVAVLSGRDLAVVVTAQSDEQLEELGRRMRELASRVAVVGATPVSCRASVGIAVHEAGETPEALLCRADLASRWAERSGADGVQRYEPSMGPQVAYEVAVHADVRDAIRRDELRVWCQPQLEIPSGRLAGVECLARWHHPAYGSVSPAEFVAAARDLGVAAELDARMVHRAVQQAKAWRTAGLFVPRVAVNVEPTSLSDPDFVGAVASALRAAQLPPASLEIELTEAVTVHDHAEARKVLWRLRALGVRLAVDDFGTGYSSLAALHHLPIDAIKLDRELVTILTEDPVLVRATVALAERLGLGVVAEGVETDAELTGLEDAGCRVAQGYLLAEPMPVEDLMAWQEDRGAPHRVAV